MPDRKKIRAEPHYTGHRSRLRDRFRALGGASLADHELVELLLGYAIPRRDTKPIAKSLIERFGSFQAIFDAETSDMEGVEGVGPYASTLVRLVKACMQRYLHSRALDAPVLGSPEEVRDYLRSTIGSDAREKFMVLCLNAAGRLVHHAVISEGTVNMAHVYPREVVRLAMEHRAVSLILVHNHPSGSLEPSEQDLRLTAELKDLCSRLGITLHDHLVVSHGGVYSIAMRKKIP